MATNWGSVWYLQITLFVELCYRIDLGDNPFPCYEPTPPRNQEVYSLGFTHRTILWGDGIITLDWNWNCEFSMFPLSNPRAEPNRSCKHFCKWTNNTPWICHLKIYQKYVLYIYIYMYVKRPTYVEISTTLGVVSNVGFDGHSIPSSLIVFHTSHYSPPLYPTWPMDYLIIFHSAPVYVP